MLRGVDVPISQKNAGPCFEPVFRGVAIFAITLFLVVGAFLSCRHQTRVQFPDETEYYTLAENLVQYHFLTWDGVSPTAARPPGFVLWLAIWKSLGVGWGGLAFLNFVIVVVAIWWLVNSWFCPEQRWMARAVIFGLLFCYPVTIYVFSTLYPQALVFALMASSFALVLSGEKWPRAVVAGLLMGWCTLAAPMYLTWAVIVGLVPLFRRRLAGVSTAAVFGTTCGLVIAGWGARNAVVMEKFVPFSTNSGINLLAGNCRNTRPNGGVTIDLSPWMKQAHDQKMDELEADAFYAAAAKEWVCAHPVQAASMYLRKLLNWFNFRNELVTKSEGSVLRDVIMFVTYYALLALLFARVILVRPTSPDRRDWLIIGGIFVGAMFAAIVTTRIRYRIPSDVLSFFVIAPLVGTVAEGILKRFSDRAG